jgi:hypothetical protein
MSFFDFDDNKNTGALEPKHTREDLLDGDTAPILCDNCPDGRVLQPYQKDKLICPNCMNVYDPYFEHIKHDTIETTIDELADTNTGKMAYLDDTTQNKIPVTKIRKKLEKDSMPDYVKQEIEHIQNRAGYYRHVPKKLSHTTRNE